MIKKTVNYTDFNGDAKSEVVYFHVSPSEWLGRAVGEDRTFAEKVKEVAESGRTETLLGTPEGKRMLDLFEDIVLSAYGKRSEDGRRFSKSNDLRNEFRESAAYDALFIELITNAEAMAAFVNNLVPAEIRKAVDGVQAPAAAEVPVLAPAEPVLPAEHILSYEEYLAKHGK